MLARVQSLLGTVCYMKGMLKNAASGVLASLPCSRTVSTLRAPDWLRPCWTDFFDHSRRLLVWISSREFACERDIQQAHEEKCRQPCYTGISEFSCQER